MTIMSQLMLRTGLLLLPVLMLSQNCRAGSPPTVPSGYQALYNLLDTNLASFNATLGPGGATYPVLYSTNLTLANANTGPQLVSPDHMIGIQTELQELQAMGTQAVMIEVGFPMLYEPFLTGQGQSQAAFISFYQQVAAMVRAAGMKLIIENDTLLSNDVQAGWITAPFYATLDWTAYQAARAADAVTVEQTLQPDYLVVLEEPDTEAANTGQTNVNTSSGAASELSGILAGLQTYRSSGLKVGAGVGTWLGAFQSFIQSFVTEPMDFIDMHIYPINDSFLPNALTIASLASGAGMPVTMSECWLNKVSDSELTELSADEVRSRDVFSFWEPLDAYFFQTMASLANYTQMAFVAPTNSTYYWTYLGYNLQTYKLDPATLLSDENTQASTYMNLASYTSTAMTYYGFMVPYKDSTPPSAPTGFSGVSNNPTTAYLTWTGATDNIGVAGFYIFRDGKHVGTAGGLAYQDTGLTEGTTYTYKLEAFDLAGNISTPTAPVQVGTREVTPPTAPGNLTATAASKKQINLSWQPSQDNSGIRYYLIFQGSSPGSLSQVGTTSGTNTSHSVYYLTPGTTYYFGVEAQDDWGNISVMSNIASATTLPN